MCMELSAGGQMVTLEARSAAVTLTTCVPGIQGPAGDLEYTLPTEIAINGNCPVTSINGYVVYADSSDASKLAIGISMESVEAGDDVTIQIGGKMTVTGAGWTDNLPVYVSTAGVLTQTKPTSGFIQEVGVAIGTDILLINIQNILIDGGNFT